MLKLEYNQKLLEYILLRTIENLKILAKRRINQSEYVENLIIRINSIKYDYDLSC